MQVTEEDVDEMVSVLKMGGGVNPETKDTDLRRWVRRKLEEGKVPCFESRRWVPREKNDEVA